MRAESVPEPVEIETSPGTKSHEPKAECSKTIAAAGFGQVKIAEVPQVWRFPSPAAFFDGISASTVRTAALLRTQTPENLARIRAEVEQETRKYTVTNGSIELPMPALLASAHKS